MCLSVVCCEILKCSAGENFSASIYEKCPFFEKSEFGLREKHVPVMYFSVYSAGQAVSCLHLSRGL